MGLPTYAGPERVLEAVSVVGVAGEDAVLGAQRRDPGGPRHGAAEDVPSLVADVDLGARITLVPVPGAVAGGGLVTRVLTALTHHHEPEFVRLLESALDVELVRRCADLRSCCPSVLPEWLAWPSSHPTFVDSTVTRCGSWPGTACGSPVSSARVTTRASADSAS